MSSPTLGEIAYTAYATLQQSPQPLYKALPYEERLGWGVGVHAAVVALDLTEPVSPPAGPVTVLALIAAVRDGIRIHMRTQHLSLKQAGKQCGIDRHTLARWLDGEENIAVQTLVTLEAWLTVLAGPPHASPD